jgi:hypothetical protein
MQAVKRLATNVGTAVPTYSMVESSWNVMALGDTRERKWWGNWRTEWVASTLHTTSEYGVSSITTADAHNSAAGSRQNWRSRRFKWTRPFRRKTKSDFCACAITFQTQSTSHCRFYHLPITIVCDLKKKPTRYRKIRQFVSDLVRNEIPPSTFSTSSCIFLPLLLLL